MLHVGVVHITFVKIYRVFLQNTCFLCVLAVYTTSHWCAVLRGKFAVARSLLVNHAYWMRHAADEPGPSSQA